LEQAGFDIKYQEELRRFYDRRDNLRQGLTKAYASIFSNYCNKTMQSRIKEHPDFETKIENDPIALLDAIKLFAILFQLTPYKKPVGSYRGKDCFYVQSGRRYDHD